MAETIIIDLDRGPSLDPDQDPGWGRGRGRRAAGTGPRAFRPPARRLRAVALVAVAVVVLGGAEPVRPSIAAVARIATRDAPVIALGPDTVAIADSGTGAGVDAGPATGAAPRNAVSAYALPGGALRWRRPLSEPVTRLTVVPGARAVLATQDIPATGGRRTTVFDARDGKTLWSSDSATVLDVPSGAVDGLVVDGPDPPAAGATVDTASGGGASTGGAPTGIADAGGADAGGAATGGADGGGGGAATVRWADLRTGRAIWSRPVSSRAAVQWIDEDAPPDAARLLLTTPDGMTEVVAERTGAVLASARLDGAVPVAGAPGTGGTDPADQAVPGNVPAGQSVIAGNHLVVLHVASGGQPTRLVGLDLSTLTPQWTDIEAESGSSYLEACGPMVCLSGGSLTAVDPATGRSWHSDRWQYAVGLGGTRVIAVDEYRDKAVVDVRTGRVLLDIAGWTPVYDPGTGRPRLLLDTTFREDDDGLWYAGFWYAGFGPGYGSVRVLGYVPHSIFGACQAAGGLLACQTAQGTVQVWRLRAA